MVKKKQYCPKLRWCQEIAQSEEQMETFLLNDFHMPIDYLPDLLPRSMDMLQRFLVCSHDDWGLAEAATAAFLEMRSEEAGYLVPDITRRFELKATANRCLGESWEERMIKTDKWSFRFMERFSVAVKE